MKTSRCSADIPFSHVINSNELWVLRGPRVSGESINSFRISNVCYSNSIEPGINKTCSDSRKLFCVTAFCSYFVNILQILC